MANVKVRSADNGDDRRISDVQLLSRASVKREFCCGPTENHVANLTPLRFCWYFNNNDSRFIAVGSRHAGRVSAALDRVRVGAV